MPKERDPNEIGALWRKTSQNGAEYFSGKIEKTESLINSTWPINIVVFENRDKKSDKHPDYRVLISRPRE